MKVFSWFLLLATALATLSLSSCMNQEGVGPNPGEVPSRIPGERQ